VQALLLPLGAELYALELTTVREVVPAPVITPLPGAAPALLGVINLRGEVVPVFDTARLLGLEPGPAADQVTVAETAAGPAGLVSHGRPRRDDLGPPAGAGALPGAVSRHAVGGAVATLLDLDALLAA
jgi:purine-binding chemotaxis protein CheW